MSKWIVDGVKAEDLAYVWAECWPYLKRAIDRHPNVEKPYTEGDILRRIMAKTLQLWIGWSVEERRVVGAVVTEITHDDKYPDKKFCSIPLVGGDEWNAWGDDLWNLIKAWAVAQNCTDVLAYGRKGWQRLYGFIEIGKSPDGVPVMVRRLKGN